MDLAIYAGSPAALVSVSSDKIAVVPEAASAPVRFVTPDEALLLQICGQWTTSEEATRRWDGAFGPDANEGGLRVAERLEALCRRGFLERLPVSARAAASQPTVTRVGIPTVGTRQSLTDTISSIGIAALQTQRSATVFVAARHAPPHVPPTPPGVSRVVTIGPAERREFVSRLAAATGVGADVVGWLVGAVESPNVGPGANRNLLLLMSAQQPFLQIDDDVRVDRLWRRSDDGLRDGVGLAMHESPAEVSVFGSREEAFAAVREAGTTIFEVADRWAAICRHRHGASAEGAGSIAAVFFGLVGDCGTDTSAMRVHQAATREQLCASDEAYSLGRRSREVVKAARGTVLGPPLWTQTTAFLQPGGSELPPFLPIERNEDGHWATLLASWRPHGLAAYVSECVAHCPDVRTGFLDDPPFSVTPATTVGLAASVAAASPSVRSSKNWYRAVGRELLHIADAGDDFEAILEAAWRRQVCGHLAGALRLLDGWPESASRSAAADLEDYANSAERTLIDPDSPAAVHRRKVARASVTEVRAFGRALEAWPTLYAAAVAEDAANGAAERRFSLGA